MQRNKIKNSSNVLLACFIFIFVCLTFFNQLVLYKAVVQITGATSLEGTVSITVLSACTIDLFEGWNFISLCAEPPNKSIEKVLEGIDFRYVLQWNETRQEFDVYSPKAASNSFDKFDTNKSYFILLSSSALLNVPGDFFDDMNISMMYGWNPPTYPYLFTTNISKYLETITGQYRYVMKWNTSGQEFIIYSPKAATPEFTTILQGEGQFILVSDPSGAVLRYNKTYLENDP